MTKLVESGANGGGIKAAGTIINSRYIIEELMNSGDFADTYLCLSVFNWEKVVIKFLRRSLDSEKVELRFYREFSAASHVRHRYVVKVLELLRHRGIPALVMEYAERGDLATHLARRGKFSIEEVKRLSQQLAEGLQAIHDAGIIHRDLKPENIFLGAAGEVKIGDFGISYMQKERRLTRENSLLGTASYMSPEYIQSGTVDVRADIYALGVIVFELLTGKLPFGVIRNVTDLKIALSSEVPDVRRIRPDCPEDLAQTVKKALSRDKEMRHASAAEFMHELLPNANQINKIPKEQLVKNSNTIELDDTQIIPNSSNFPFTK